MQSHASQSKLQISGTGYLNLPPTHTGRSRQLDTKSTNQRVQEPANSGMESGVRGDIRQAGEGRSAGADGENMTCKSCMFTECSGRSEGVWCERGVYEPGTDEDEK